MNTFKGGEFFVGCNYWASHAGTNMWSDWRADVVEDDFKRLSQHNITTLRVFPLWSVFQPITMLYAGGGIPREYRFGENTIPETEAGRHGMSETAISHFEEFCILAEKYGIRLIVGLITGWMSGRLFVPPALEKLNILTNPEAIMWETRFVRYFVNHFKNYSAIFAWDLGNECNCMAPVSNAEEFYVWTSNIVGAIRANDDTRPVVSGMHSLLPDNYHTIQHQAELTDYLTTHPYPYFTPHCDMDPINSIRTELHATSETLFYSGIGNKPCFVEECGTLGPMFADEEKAADFIRVNMFSLWAHDCLGFLWWCANEQVNLTHAPYDWNSVERELGLFRVDKTPKPVLHELDNFSKMLSSLEFSDLPKRITEGVCILSRGQDTWGAAYMSFILAKKVGLDLSFIYSDQPLPESKLYLLPSISGDSYMSGRKFKELLDKVYEGSTLYISLNSGLLSPFTEFSGVKVCTRKKVNSVEKIYFTYNDASMEIPLYVAFKLEMKAIHAKVLAIDADNNPVYTEYDYGKGKVFFLSAPLETGLTSVSDAFGADKYYEYLYQPLKDCVASQKIAKVTGHNVGITEHIIDDNKRILVLINYEPKLVNVSLSLQDGWKVNKYHHGNLELPKNNGAIIEIIK